MNSWELVSWENVNSWEFASYETEFMGVGLMGKCEFMGNWPCEKLNSWELASWENVNSWGIGLMRN